MLQRLAAVLAQLDVDVDRPDPVGAVRIDEELVVVLRAAAAVAVVGGAGRRGRPALRRASAAAAASQLAAAPLRGGRIRAVAWSPVGGRRSAGSRRRLRGGPAASAAPSTRTSARHAADARPRRAGVIRAEEAGLRTLRVDQSRRRGSGSSDRRQPGTPGVAGRQAVGQLRPLLAAVGRLVNARRRARRRSSGRRRAAAGRPTRTSRPACPAASGCRLMPVSSFT